MIKNLSEISLTMFINGVNTGIEFVGNLTTNNIVRFTNKHYLTKLNQGFKFGVEHNLIQNQYFFSCNNIWWEDQQKYKYKYDYYCSFGTADEKGHFIKKVINE